MLIPLIFSMGFQSFHEFEHLKVQLSEQNCNHSTNQKNQITHEHHGYDNCSTCEFTISHFLSTQNLFFKVHKKFRSY